MNNIPSWPTIIQLIYGLILLGAAISDGTKFKIPNAYPAALILLFPIAWFAHYPFIAPLWSHILHFAIALGVGMLLFRFEKFGAGDAKLYAATALWFGMGEAIRLLLFISLTGAIIVIIRMATGVLGIFWGGEGKTLQTRLLDRRIAYGIPIAIGGILALIAPHSLNIW
jgi:prepilin peptidase CpaA